MFFIHTALQRGDANPSQKGKPFKRFLFNSPCESTALKRGVNERKSIPEPFQRLPGRELNQMTVRITHHGEVTYDSANIHRRLDEDVLLPRQFGDAIDFFTRLALKSEMIETRFYFILHDDQDEHRIFTGRRLRSEPNVVTAFGAAVTNDR